MDNKIYDIPFDTSRVLYYYLLAQNKYTLDKRLEEYYGYLKKNPNDESIKDVINTIELIKKERR